jgi:hemin uptake protein HemP
MSDDRRKDDRGTVLHNAQQDAASSRAITVNGERIDSRELFAAGRQISIVHGGEIYSLRLTAQNKLILTK